MTVEQELEQANADLKTAREQAQKNYSDLQNVTAERDAFKAKAAELEGHAETLAKGLNEAKEKLTAHATELAEAKKVTVEAVNARAVEIISAAGHAALPQKSGASSSKDGNEKTRADFDAMPSAEQRAFIKAGGKLVD